MPASSVTGVGLGGGQLGVQEVQLQGLQGALRQLQQETEQNCRRELQQMRGQLAGLRARMASLRQGCGDLRGLVSTFTQSCQGSLSEAQGQVSWALGALSADGAGTQLAEAPQGPLPGCPGRLLELKGTAGLGSKGLEWQRLGTWRLFTLQDPGGSAWT